MQTQQQNKSWRQKVCHVVTNLSLPQKFVMMSNICRDVNKYFMTSTNTSRPQKVCHDVFFYVITSKSSSWCQKLHHYVKKFLMTSKIYHDIKNMSWCQNVRHDIKKFVITAKSESKRQTFVRKSKSLSWRHKLWCKKVHHYVKNVYIFCHYVKNSSWRQKSSSWHQKYVMTSKCLSQSQKYVMTSTKFVIASQSSS